MLRLIAGLRRPRARYAALSALVLSMVLPMSRVQADYIHLKDGRIADGKFTTVEGADYVFRSGGKLLRAGIKDTRKMVVGYRGVPVCFRLHGGLKDCAGLLFVLEPREALIGYYEKSASGKPGAGPRGGWMRASIVRLDRIAFLEFKTRRDGRLPLIRPGVKLSSDRSDAPAEVSKAGRNELRFRMGDGREKILRVGKRALALRLLPPRIVPDKKEPESPKITAWHYFVPGMVQWRRDEKLNGGLFMGAFAGLTALAYQEFRHASSMAAKINRNPVELYFSSLAGGDRAAYAGHVNRYRALLGMQFIAYGLAWVHALGWWPFSPNAPASDQPVSDRPAAGGLRPAFFIMPAKGDMPMDSGLRLNWNWRF